MENTINVEAYNLPDSEIINSPAPLDFCIWRPDDIYIVLGRANNADSALHTDLVSRDRIRVLKRPSGGETVILSPSMAVFSIKFSQISRERPRSVFDMINSHLIASFENAGIKNLNTKGISDISIGNLKILGSSMYLNNNTLFYHAVLNVSEDISLISKYLKHPGKEPDYRNGRPHNEFVTSLHKEGYHLSVDEAEQLISNAFHSLQKEINKF